MTINGKTTSIPVTNTYVIPSGERLYLYVTTTLTVDPGTYTVTFEVDPRTGNTDTNPADNTFQRVITVQGPLESPTVPFSGTVSTTAPAASKAGGGGGGGGGGGSADSFSSLPAIKGVIHQGDGTYTLKAGDAVVSDQKYLVLVRSVNASGARVLVWNPSRELVGNAFLAAQDSIPTVKDLGLTIRSESLTGATVTLHVSHTIVMQFIPGWNLFSVPLRMDPARGCKEHSQCLNETKEQGIEIRESTCDTLKFWQYTPTTASYERTPLRIATGLWVKSTKPCTVTVAGVPLTEKDMVLSPGWNLVGGGTAARNVTTAFEHCQVLQGPYSYDPVQTKYVAATMVGGGTAVAVRVAAACTLR